MRVKVKLIRQRGDRRSDREISADEGVDGYLVMHTVAGVPEMTLHNGSGRMERLIPDLYFVKVVAIGHEKMMFEGFEQAGEQGSWYMQTWSVMVLPR